MTFFTAIAASIAAGTFWATVGTYALQAAVGFGLSLIAQSLAGKPQKPSFGVKGRLQSGGDLPRSFMLGWGATAGSLVYANTWGASGKTPNEYLVQVIALSDLPADSLSQVWVNGEKVTLGGTAHADYGFPVIEYLKSGKDNLWVKFYDGTQTAPDSYLTSKFGGSDRPYDGGRVGVGIPYVIITARVNEELFTGFPQFKFALNGAKLYDISKDTTAGGSGTHRWGDPSTWGGDGDHLPAVQIYNLLRGVTYGGEWFYGLQGMSAARLPAADWIAQINKCRAGIAGPSGTEPTYRSGGEIAVNAPIADAIEAILTTCQGRLAEVGGVYKLHVGAPGSAVMAFDDGDIISTQEQSFTPFIGLSETINGINATYPSPAEGWNSKVAKPLYRPDYEVLDGNRRLLADVSLDLVPYDAQVQRLMKSALQEARRARRHTFVLPPEAWILEPGDVVSWTSERNGYEAKLFRVDGVVDMGNLDVMVDLTEVDPSDYDWDQATDYTPVVDGPLVVVRPAPQPIVDWFVAPDAILDNSGTQRRPAIRLEWDGDQADVVAVAFEVRLADTLEVVYRGRTDNVAAGSILISQSLLPAESYGVRGRYIPGSPRETLWSDWLAVTTLDIKLTGLDFVFDGIVGFDSLSSDVAEWQEWISGGTRQVLAMAQRISQLAAEQDLANYDDKQVLLREIRSATAEVEAGFAEAILVATGPGSAIGEAVSTLYAALGGNTAQVNVRFSVEAAPTGYSARYGVQAAVDDGQYRSAGFFLDVPSSPSSPTRVVLAGDQTVVLDNSGNVLALFTSDGKVATARIPNIVAGMIAAEAIDTADLFVDGVVITDVIAANAVSNMAIAYTAGSTTSFTVQSATVPSGGTGRAHIRGTFVFTNDSSQGSVVIGIQLYKNGALMRTVSYDTASGADAFMHVTYVDDAAASGDVWELRTNSQTGGDVMERTLEIVNLKR